MRAQRTVMSRSAAGAGASRPAEACVPEPEPATPGVAAPATASGFPAESAAPRATAAVPTPHDDLFRFTFRHARHAAAWLRAVLPTAVRDAIDWTSLRPAPESVQDRALRVRLADLVFAAERTGTRAPLWLLVEHKSHRDAGVDDQLLRYAVLLRDLTPDPAVRPPTPVVAVLLHHGDAPFASHHREDALAALQPRLPFVVDDLAGLDEAAIRARPLTPFGTLTQLCLRRLRGLDDAEALAAFERWADLMRAADRDDGLPRGHDALRAIGYHALRMTEIPAGELHATFERLLQRPEETIMSTAEKLRNEGIAKGRAEGIAEGKAEGKAESLLLLLRQRFGEIPPPVVVRLRAGTPAELDRWIGRILDAATVDDVFAGS